MASIYTHKDKNIRKTWLLMTLFFGAVIAVGWVFSWYLESSVFVVVAVVLAAAMNIASYWYSDKLVVKMTGTRPIEKSDDPELYNIVENLSITAGLPIPKLYMMDEDAPNAFATGRDPKHAVVAVTSGLRRILDRTELEGVLAHELSHIGNRDMLVSTVAVVLVGFVAILADIFLRASFFGGRGENRNPIVLIVGVLVAILAPLAAQLIHFAISRKREFLADASGALLTRYPEGLASALKKISTYSRPMRKANHATAHLFIANPFGGKAGAALNRMFSTHPPVEDRINALLGKQ